jgi:hypothetical protein
MSEGPKPLRRRILYYPKETGEGEGQIEEIITPRPALLRRTSGDSSRPYFFPIIGRIMELIMSILDSRMQGFEPQYRRSMPRKLVREVVRDEYGRVTEESFTEY